MSENITYPRFITLERDIMFDWDDDNKFMTTYYDREEKKIMINVYGHGVGDKFEKDSIKYVDAINSNVISTDELVNALLDHMGVSVKYADEMRYGNYSIPCKVKGGNKMKNKENLVFCGCFTVRHQYNIHWDKTFAIVANPETKEFAYINPFYVEFTYDFRKAIYDNVINDNSLLRTLVHCLAYKHSYSRCDWDTNYKNAMHKLVFANMEGFDLSGYSNPWEEKNVKKHIETKRKDITAWANNKFKNEKTEDEINDIIERTLNKICHSNGPIEIK